MIIARTREAGGVRHYCYWYRVSVGANEKVRRWTGAVVRSTVKVHASDLYIWCG